MTKRILIIKLGALGDFILMTGMFAAIRKKYPDAHITLMTASSFIKLAEKSGYFDDYIIDNRTHSIRDYIRIIKTLANGHFHMIFDLQGQKRTRRLYYTLGRFFTNTPWTWAKLSRDSFILRLTPSKPRFFWGSEKQQQLFITPEEPSLNFCKANKAVLEKLPKRYVLLIPGCSPLHPYKRWPVDSYQKLALFLAKKGIASVVLGTNAERQEIESICQKTPYAVNFCNQSSLLDIPEIAEKALAVVGNDTGPQHMAELTNTPSITLFSAKTKQSAVQRKNIQNLFGEEMADISVQQVLNALQFLWHKA